VSVEQKTRAPDSNPSHHVDARTAGFYRDQLRDARSAVLRDAEAFPELFFAFERLGGYLLGKRGSLARYRDAILEIARLSPMGTRSPTFLFSCFHSSVEVLYTLVQDERNQALHQGVFARHLASHAMELSLILEEGLMSGTDRVGDLMVRAPICAEAWHPISHVRREMLTNSFSFLPTYVDWAGSHQEGWYLLSDLAIAQLLREHGGEHREIRLFCTVKEAIQDHGLEIVKASTTAFDARALDVLACGRGKPVLVLDDRQRVIGIATAFDLL
jgi:hypothetical protein